MGGGLQIEFDEFITDSGWCKDSNIREEQCDIVRGSVVYVWMRIITGVNTSVLHKRKSCKLYNIML